MRGGDYMSMYPKPPERPKADDYETDWLGRPKTDKDGKMIPKIPGWPKGLPRDPDLLPTRRRI